MDSTYNKTIPLQYTYTADTWIPKKEGGKEREPSESQERYAGRQKKVCVRYALSTLLSLLLLDDSFTNDPGAIVGYLHSMYVYNNLVTPTFLI